MMEKVTGQIFGDNNEDLFITFKKESAVDLVINNIKNLLITKKLMPGDKLPSEAELCKGMSVSRGSLREAMKILSAFGIVEIRRGDGTYITSSDNKVMFDPLLFSLIQSHADIKQLSELRGVMEHGIIKLILENATEQNMNDIKSEYSKMEAAIKQKNLETEALADLDIGFHAALGRATNNVLVEKIYNFIMDFFKPTVQLTFENEKTGLNALKIHKNILDALIDKDTAKAAKAINDSIVEWERMI